jgi:hypothetical protein
LPDERFRRAKGLCRLVSSSSISTTTLSWVSACSTVVEHSQHEGFTECRCQRHVKPPTWRTRDLERSNFRHKRPPGSEATLANPAAEGGTMGENWPRILPKVVPSCHEIKYWQNLRDVLWLFGQSVK